MLKNLTDFNPDGWNIGQSATDKIAFYGAPPVTQRPGGAQSPLMGMPGNQFITFQFTCTPSAVGANTTVESTITASGILTTDLIVAINKPTAQAGLGLVGWRNSTTQNGTIYMTFGNSTSVTTSPTAGETYNVVVMRGGPIVSQSITPAPVPASTTMEQIFSLTGSGAVGTAIINAAGQVTGVQITAGGSGYWIPPTVTFTGGGPQPSMVQSGTFSGLDAPAATAAMPYGSGATGIAVINSAGQIAGVKITNPRSGYQTAPIVTFNGGNWFQPGQFVAGSKPSTQTGLGIAGWRIPGTGQIGISYTNYTTSAITPTAGETYSFLALNEMPPVSAWMEYGATFSTGASVGAATSNEQAISITGVAGSGATSTPDWIIGISKPSTQAGLIVGGARVATTSNAIYVNFGNLTAVTTTPVSETYIITVGKISAPMAAMLYPQYVSSFTSVAANTSAEQTVTVSGVVAGSTAVVNYVGGSLPAGLSIAGARVSAANVVAVNWQNNTASTITPPTGPYLFGNYPVPGPGVGNYAAVIGSPSQYLNNGLTNEVQQLLSTIGLNRGY